MATGGSSSLFDGVPPLSEICNYAKIPNWYELGVQLELKVEDLEKIKTDPTVTDKLSSMYQVWLDRKAGSATRKQLLKALRTNHVGQNRVADNYEQELERMVSKHSTIQWN